MTMKHGDKSFRKETRSDLVYDKAIDRNGRVRQRVETILRTVVSAVFELPRPLSPLDQCLLLKP